MKVEYILEKLIQYNTVADKENKQITLYLSEFLKSNGFFVEIIKDEENKKFNVFAYNGPINNAGVFFVGHTDTVPASESWTIDPLKLTKKGDKLFGLGSSDMKGGIAAFMSAINMVNFKKAKKSVGVILTYDEEKTFAGIKNFVKKKKISNSKIIIAEPTDGKPISATKGAVAFKVDFFGKEAHGSTPQQGENAIKMACGFIMNLEKIHEIVRREKNTKFKPSCATMNIGRIIGGDAINKVPSRCVLEFEFRTINDNQEKYIISEIKKIIKKEKINAKLSILIKMKPLANKGKKFINLVEIITNKKAKGVNYATEGSFLKGKNNEIIILGPGPINAHKANEYVSKKSLDKIAKIYKRLIEKVCL